MKGPLPGWIVVLNGAPRSGKSSIAQALQAGEGVWISFGVDAMVKHVIPEKLRPGIGLRPGGERADLEPYLPGMFVAMYDAVAAFSRQGLNVVVDVGHHDSYSQPMGILVKCAERLTGLPVLFVGIRCPIEEIMRRRNAGGDGYLTGPVDAPPEPVLRWQSEVHKPGIYDLEIDTSTCSPDESARRIRKRLSETPFPDAFWRAAS